MSAAVFETLKARGFVQQCTDEAAVRELLDGGPVTFYNGFDCTAASLHAGHLVPIMAMMHLQRAGHRPIVLLGGGTTLIGDPTGKDESDWGGNNPDHWYPMNLRFQVVLVPAGGTFSGWQNYP